MTITEADLMAVCQTLRELGEEADSMSFETLLDRGDALLMVGDAVKAASNQIDTAKKARLERGEKVLRGHRFFLRQAGKIRHRHDVIARRLIDKVKRDHLAETGEILDPTPLQELARHFITTFLSASDTAKGTALQSLLDIDPKRQISEGVAWWDPKGTRIEAEPVKEP